MPELQLHDYQVDAVNFVIKNKTVMLALDLGMGKTVITLKAISELKRPAIVFGPLNTIYNTWPEEIKKWVPHLTYDILHGPSKNKVFEESNADIFLTNYHSIKWFLENVTKSKKLWRKRILVLDESSMIKSPKAQRFKLLKKTMALWDEYRLCLSATPIPNGFQDLWTQYYVLDKGNRLFSSFGRYRSHYFHYTGPPLFKTTIKNIQASTQIGENIKDITYRLKAEDYLNMPKYIHNEIFLSLPKKLDKEYKQLEKDFFLSWQGTEATAYNAAALSMKLRQFVQGAVYTDKGDGDFYPIHTAKIDALKELLEVNSGRPILCPIQFKFERKMLNAFMKVDLPCVAGGTTPIETKRYITEWNKGNIPILLCHPASIGHGVNLQSGGHIVLWFGLPWNLEYYKQLNGRVYRQGQKKTVVINHLIMKGTIDERINKVLKQKDATQESLLNSLRR